jgi:YrbI family 3-deoxy-D-manno-octulosonate 8-phosphate phosphatase
MNNRHHQIKLLVLDVDGVLTDGGMYYSNSGDEFKKFNTKDGMGIKLAIESGIKVGFLSNGKNDILIKNRAALLGVEFVYVGADNKLAVLKQWMHDLQIEFDNIAYIGDDINDLEIMDNVEFNACPLDAVPKVKMVAKYLLDAKGGEGCVREFIDAHLL